MTYILKAFIVALVGATALTVQVATVNAMGSDRDPNTTNLIVRSSPQEHATTQKNKVFTVTKNTVHTSVIGNENFLAQR